MSMLLFESTELKIQHLHQDHLIYLGSCQKGPFCWWNLAYFAERSRGKKFRGMLDLLLMEKILHQLIGGLSQYYQGFICSRWCRMSSINRITGVSAGNFDIWHWLPGWRFDTLLKREYVDAALLGILCPWYLDEMQNCLFAWDDFGHFWIIEMILDHCWLNDSLLFCFLESWWSRLVQLKVVYALILGRCHFPRDCHRAKRGARMITLRADMLKALKDCRREVQMIHAWLFWF